MLSSETLYTTYMKIRYSNDLFKMAGNQFSFTYNSDYDIFELLKTVSGRLQILLAKYHLDSHEIVYIQLVFSKVNSSIITEFSK